MGTYRLVSLKYNKMKIALIILICLTSCTTMKETNKIRFVYYDGLKKHKIIMNIPKGSKLIKITAGGEGEEHRYWYPDSSVLYLSSIRGSATLNELLINRQQDYYNKRFMSDTASFTGTDEKGNYWKEMKNGSLFYGYSNVPIDKKKIFDEAIIPRRLQ